MSSKKLKVEGTMDLDQAIVYLENVLASLREGRIKVETADDAVTLIPEKVVKFEMSVSQKKDKEKFTVEIAWKTDADSPSRRGFSITPGSES